MANSASYQLVAKFDGLAAAQRAVTALGIAGIGGENISLGGAAAVEAREQLATDAADVRTLMHILKYIIIGAIIGTVIGAALSPLVAWVVLGLIGTDITAKSLLLSLFLTTLMSHMIGGFIGYTLAMQAGQSWELSFQTTRQSEVFVQVHVVDPQIADRAEDVLRRQQANNVYRRTAAN